MIQSVLVQKAISAALNSQWSTAIELNEKILEQHPQDLDSLNRLARACFETGDITRSKKIYKEVLDYDPYNVIALKNIKRFQLIKGTSESFSSALAKSGKSGSIGRSITSFIEEPGKTKVVQLTRLAEPQVLFTLHCGDEVTLLPKLRGVQISTESGVYIGRLPDDIGFHLQTLIKSGNKYEAFIKQISANVVHIFIREISRVSEYASRPTFSYISENTAPALETGADGENTPETEEDSASGMDEQL